MADSSETRLVKAEHYNLNIDGLLSPGTVYARRIKRVFDLFAVIALSAFVIPLIALITLLAVAGHGRPVFFRQRRFGKDGSRFDLLKFRTMIRNDSPPSTVTVSGDSRITAFGRFLRRFKLDELPQFWNVMVGHMSFVGPRPDMPEYIDLIPQKYRSVLCLKPGITGPATIAFKNEEYLLSQINNAEQFNDRILFPLKQAINQEYLVRMSPALDIKCMIATFFPPIAPILGFRIFTSVDEVKAEFKKRLQE